MSLSVFHALTSHPDIKYGRGPRVDGRLLTLLFASSEKLKSIMHSNVH